VVVGVDLGAQVLQGGGVAVVDVGAFRGGREVAEDVAQVEDAQSLLAQSTYLCAEFVGVGVDVVVGDAYEVAENVAPSVYMPRWLMR